MALRVKLLRVVRILLSTEFTLESVKIIISGCAPVLLSFLSLADLGIDIAETVIGWNLLTETKFEIALIIGLILSAIALLVELGIDFAHDFEKMGNGVNEEGAVGGLCLGFFNCAISLPVIVLLHLKVTSASLRVCPNGDHTAYDNAVIWTSALAPVIMILAPFTFVGIVLAPLWYAFLTFVYPILYWSNPCKHVMILVIALTVPSTWSLVFSIGAYLVSVN